MIVFDSWDYFLNYILSAHPAAVTIRERQLWSG